MIRVECMVAARPSLWRIAAAALGAVLTGTLAVTTADATAGTKRQATFASPEQAVQSLVAASRDGKTEDLVRILGPGSKPLVFSGDPVADRQGREHFVAAYDQMSKLVSDGGDKVLLEIGNDDWPFPIPLVRDAGLWHFDTAAGKREILDRRIGRNELSAIQVCRAYVDAQHEYAAEGMAGGGLREFAQHFMSRPGRHDGLYWQAAPGAPESPMGPLIAEARSEGYGAAEHAGKHAPYHGYYYRILRRQGPSARGGAYDYVVNGHMIGGFALVAYPAKYGDSGVMTFIVNQDGAVYQKDLGRRTAELARSITAFDPDGTWRAQ